MVRTPSFDKSGLKKGTWTPEEDRKLIAYVTRYGCWNWRQLPRFAGLARCGKSCRLRWMNYLRPNIKRGNYTQEEEDIIIRLHEKLGNKWSAIANHLPGRTDNEIKNHWHTTLKKRFQQNAVTHKNAKASKSKDNESGQERDSVPNNGFFQDTPPAASQISDNGPLSPQLSSSELSSITTDHSTTATSNENLVTEDDLAFLYAYTQPMNESFWTEAYVSDISCSPVEIMPAADGGNGTLQSSDANACTISPQSSSGESLVMENDFAFLDAHTETTVEEFWTQPYVADVSHVPSKLLSPLANGSEYFSPMYDSGLWTQSHFHGEYISLF